MDRWTWSFPVPRLFGQLKEGLVHHIGEEIVKDVHNLLLSVSVDLPRHLSDPAHDSHDSHDHDVISQQTIESEDIQRHPKTN